MNIIKCPKCGKCFHRMDGQDICPFCGEALFDLPDYDFPDWFKGAFDGDK